MKGTSAMSFSQLVDRHKNISIILGLVLLTVSAYGQLGSNGFITLDDAMYITGNDMLQKGLSLETLRWAFTNADPYWHPVTWLSLLVDHALFGLNPAGFHLVNLLLHTANAVILFSIFRQMSRGVWESAFVAALFALHPLNVESVAWAVERKDVLSTFFWMLTIWLYLRYLQRTCWQRYVMVFLAFALGLMAKLMIVTLPFVLLLLDYWPLHRLGPAGEADSCSPAAARVSYGRLALEKIPLFLLSAGSFAISLLGLGSGGSFSEIVGTPLRERVLHSLAAYVVYIGKIVWPAKLAVYYPYHSYPLWQAGGALLLLGGITVYAFRVRRRIPWFVVGWCWFLGVMLPVIGIVRTGEWPDIANRFTYLPAIGLYVILAWGGAEAFRTWQLVKAVRWGAALLAIFVLAFLTFIQVGYWRNDITLFSQAVKVTRDNELAYGTLGTALLKAGKQEEGLGMLKRQQELNSASNGYDLALGRLRYESGDFAAAKEVLLQALNKDDNKLGVMTLLAEVYEGLNEKETAIQTYNKIIVSPDRDSGFYKENAQRQLDSLRALYRPELDALRSAVLTQPSDVGLRSRLALRLDSLGFLEEALHQYEELERRGLNQWQLYYNMGNIYKKLKEYEAAARCYEKVLGQNPTHVDSLNNLGVVYKEAGAYDKAIDCFKKAVALDRNNVNPLFNLATTYLKAGERREAFLCLKEIQQRFPSHAGWVAPHLKALATYFE